jgi:hypothetical protein
MKLNQILSQINQVERSKFVNCLDKIRAEAIRSDVSLSDSITQIDGQLKSASSGEINQLFSSVIKQFTDYVRDQIALGDPQISLLINILARDGNNIARLSWIEKLFEVEHNRLCQLSTELRKEVSEAAESDGFDRGTRLSIYKDCFDTAYTNDLRFNREARITDDERMILNTLANKLGMSTEEVTAVEHISVPVAKTNVIDALNTLRELGIVFIDRRRSEVLVADEVVEVIHSAIGKEIPDKYALRILRSLSDAELSCILRRHGQKGRGVERQEKIKYIAHSGISIRTVLSKDMFAPEENVTKRKERLKTLLEDLNVSTSRIGTTLDDRISVLVDSLKQGADKEFDTLSASGFKSLVASLSNTTPPVLDRIRHDFEIEDNEALNTDRLRALGISPLDILYVYSNDEVKKIRDSLNLSIRQNPRTAILQSFASANDKLVDNYELLAQRDIAGLKSAGIEIKEADIGVKFEDITRTLLERLGQKVDEELRKEINTAKDKADIILSLSDDDIIVGEVKSHKNGDFAKYSTTSRQVKAYANRCEASGKRVAQVLIIAPSFSQDFIDSAEMDTDINISLLEAKGLKKIVDAYASKRNPNFSAKLLTKGGLLKSDLIAKTI